MTVQFTKMWFWSGATVTDIQLSFDIQPRRKGPGLVQLFCATGSLGQGWDLKLPCWVGLGWHVVSFMCWAGREDLLWPWAQLSQVPQAIGRRKVVGVPHFFVHPFTHSGSTFWAPPQAWPMCNAHWTWLAWMHPEALQILSHGLATCSLPCLSLGGSLEFSNRSNRVGDKAKHGLALNWKGGRRGLELGREGESQLSG